MAPLLIAMLLGVGQAVQPPTPPTGSSRPWAILDNSFLVEEAFNQEAKVVQNIFNWNRLRDTWLFTFTQEWPVPGERHQLSYTILFASIDNSDALGDALINYRLQVLDEGPGKPAFAPRLSAIVPTGSRTIGAHQGGLQANLPFSKQHNDFYFHGNAGFTWLPRERRDDFLSPAIAGSVIYRAADMCNLMLESVVAYNATDLPNGSTRRLRAIVLSPGIRGGWNLKGDKQIVIGGAIRSPGSTARCGRPVRLLFVRVAVQE